MKIVKYIPGKVVKQFICFKNVPLFFFFSWELPLLTGVDSAYA